MTGSTAEDLTVCAQGVGLALRSDLAVMSVSAPSWMLAWLLERVAGYNVAAGGVVFDDGAWWCRSSTRSEVIVVCPRACIERVKESFDDRMRPFQEVGGPDLVDRSDEYQVLNIVGRKCEAVAAELGVFGRSDNAESASPFSQTQMRRWAYEVAWLVEGTTSVLALVRPNYGPAVWNAIEQVGRPHGIRHVGIEAIERYVLQEPSSQRGMTLP